MAEIESLVFKADTKSIKQGTADLDKMDQSAERLDNTVNNLPRAFKQAGTQVKTTTAAFKGAKNATQQLSWQLQDVAVMLQGGASPFLILGTQGSQIASAFGSGGAIVGAMIAFGSLLGGTVFSALTKTKDGLKMVQSALEELDGTIVESEDGIQRLSKEFEELAARSTAMAMAKLKADMLDARDAMSALDNETEKLIKNLISPAWTGLNLTEATADISSYGGNIDGLNKKWERVQERLKLTDDQTKELRKSFLEFGHTRDIDALRESVDSVFSSISGDPAEAMRQFQSGLQGVEKDANKLKESMAFLTQTQAGLQKGLENGEGFAALEEDIYTLEGRLESWIESEQKASEKFKKEQEKRAEDLKKEQESLAAAESRLQSHFDTKRKIREDAYNKERALQFENHRRQEEEDIRTAMLRQAFEIQSNQVVVQARQQFLGQMGTLLQQGVDQNSAAAKMGYAISQGVQVAQAINNANLTYTGIIAAASTIPDPTGATLTAAIGRAELMRNLGYATAAMIAGTAVGTLAGRAQGGQVRPGESYVVGEKGPERLTMGSMGGRITPSVGSSAPMINVMASVKVIGGPGDAEVETTTKQISDTDFVVGIVVNQMKPGSRSRKQLESTSNVQGKGR